MVTAGDSSSSLALRGPADGNAAGHPSQPAAYTPSTTNTSDFVDRNRIALRGA